MLTRSKTHRDSCAIAAHSNATPRWKEWRARRAQGASVFALVLVFLTGCQSNLGTAPSTDISAGANESIEQLLILADTAELSADRVRYRARAITALVSQNAVQRAVAQLERLPAAASAPADQRIFILLARASISIALGDPRSATTDLLIIEPDPAQLSPATVRSLSDATWAALGGLSATELEAFTRAAETYSARGWLELNRAIRSEDFSLRGQLDAISRWQRVWTQHAAANTLPSALLGLAAEWDRRPRHIALLLPLQQAAGRALQEGFIAAYYQSLAISREVPRVTLIDSTGATSAQALYNEATLVGADLIIGPLDKALVSELTRIASRSGLRVPTLALNYADDETETFEDSSVTQFGLAPEDEIDQVVALVEDNGFRRAAVVTPEGESYSRLSNEFTSRWAATGGSVVSQTTFGENDDYSTVIKGLLAIDASEARAQRLRATLPRNNIEFTPQRRSDIDFVFLIANPRQARQLVPTLAFYYAQDLPVFALPSIYDGSEVAATRDLDGITFGDGPWMVTDNALRRETDAALPSALGATQRLRAMGVDSFYLAMQLKQLRENPARELQGVTGSLRLSPSGRVQRELLPVRFDEGIPKPL